MGNESTKRDRRREKRHRQAAKRWQVRREHIKAIIDGPDSDIDRMMLAVRANRGRLPAGLIQGFGLKDDPAAVAKIERLVRFPFKLLPSLPWKPW